MGEPTPAVTFICFVTTLFVIISVGYAGVELYRFWNRNLPHLNSISGFYQIIKLVGLILASAVTIFGSIYILYFFLGLFIVYVSELLG
jgi:hypothetical protein